MMRNKCSQCGTTEKELRPYGPNGSWVCFDCGMKPELKQLVEENFIQQLHAAGAINGKVIIGGEEDPVPMLDSTNSLH